MTQMLGPLSKEFYRDISHCFVSIRCSYSRKIYDDNFIYYKNALSPFYNELKCRINENSNYILVYCIDTLFDIITEGDYIKINCFADTIHNMPEICMGIRPLSTFVGEISEFRNRYGNNYFPFFNE